MPLRYSTAKNIKAAIRGQEIYCVGVNIRLPRSGTPTLTYYYEALDSTGAVVDRAPITVPLAQVATEKPLDYATVYGILKIDTYERALARYPDGGTVS